MEPDLIKSNKYKNFFAHIGFFRKKNLVDDVSSTEVQLARQRQEEVEREKIRVNHYISSLIKDENFEALTKFFREGVAFNRQHMREFLKSPYVFNSRQAKENFIETNASLIKEFVISSLSELDSKCKTEKNYYKGDFKDIGDGLRNLCKIKKLECLDDDIFLNDKEYIDKFYIHINSIAKKHDGMDKFLSSSFRCARHDENAKGLVEFTETLYPALLSAYNKLNSDEITNNIKIAKIIFNADMEKHISSSMHQAAESFQFKKLPLAAQKIINDIKNTSIYLMSNTDSLSQTDNLDFDKLYNKRLPQVLQEYGMVSEEYKSKLKNEKINPDTLLVESLELIRNKLNTMSDDLQESNMHKMKVSNQYLKRI